MIQPEKLSRKYQTSATHIELIIYTNSYLITTNNEVIEQIQGMLSVANHPFKKIWYMGNDGKNLVSIWEDPSTVRLENL